MSNDEISNFETKGRFETLDYFMFISLITVSFIIGITVGVKGWKTTTEKDFLVGGRNMHLFPLAMSLIGGVVSANAILGIPADVYRYGMQSYLSMVGFFWGTMVVLFIILPILYPLELISIMQYMEMRFHSKTLKKLCSFTQICSSLFFMGVCLYAPSLALSSVTNIPNWISALFLGLVCALYISIGGVKAVVYTDVLQTSIMFIGILIVVIVTCIDLGGVGVVLDMADRGGRMEFFNFDPSPFVKYTFWSAQVLGLQNSISIIGLSQSQFQRFNSVKSLKDSQRLCILFLIGLTVLWSIFYFSGLVAYANYFDCDPLINNRIEKADQIIPLLVAEKLGYLPGMIGLFVAAVYGAVLSSLSTSANSIAALLWDDFLKEWEWFRRVIIISPTSIMRIISLTAGTIAVGVALFVGRLGGTIIQITFILFGSLAGPICGLFITGLTAPWVRVKGALLGFVASLAFNIWLLLGKFLYGAAKDSPLPLSTNGCPTNSTTLQLQNENILWNNVTLSLGNNENFPGNQYTIYDISFCYLGTIGVLIVFIVSSVTSLTDLPNPEAIDSKLFYGPSLSFYKKAWNRFSKKKMLGKTILEKEEEEEKNIFLKSENV